MNESQGHAALNTCRQWREEASTRRDEERCLPKRAHEKRCADHRSLGELDLLRASLSKTHMKSILFKTRSPFSASQSSFSRYSSIWVSKTIGRLSHSHFQTSFKTSTCQTSSCQTFSTCHLPRANCKKTKGNYPFFASASVCPCLSQSLIFTFKPRKYPSSHLPSFTSMASAIPVNTVHSVYVPEQRMSWILCSWSGRKPDRRNEIFSVDT